MIHFAHHISVYYPIFTCDSSIFPHNISLNEVLCQTKKNPGGNTLTHSVLFCFVPLIPARFHRIIRHQHVFHHFFRPACWQHQSGNIKCGRHIRLLWGFRILDAILHLSVEFCVSLPAVFAGIWITEVTIPVGLIFLVRNAFICTVQITFGWMVVDSFDSVDITYVSSSSREVLCSQSWWQWWSFWLFTCRHTIMLEVWPGCFDDLFSIWNISYGCHLLLLGARFLQCSIWVLAARPHCPKVVYFDHSVQFLSSTTRFSSKSFSVLVVCNAGSWTTNIPLLARANYLTMTFPRSASPVVFHCLQPLMPHTREKLACTLTPCGMIENISRAPVERSAFFARILFCWCYWSVISGTKNLVLISIGLGW